MATWGFQTESGEADMDQVAADEQPGDDIQPDHQERSRRAAKEADPEAFIASIWKSGIVDGLVRRLRATWPRTPPAMIHDFVCHAVESVYERLRDRVHISNLNAYLYKASYTKGATYFRHAERDRETLVPPDDLATRVGNDDAERATRDDPVDRRQAAVQVARSLLPKLGTATATAVMEYILDAVAKGVVDLTNNEVADALGMAPKTVRQATYRGFKRLEDRARKAGFHLPDLDLDTLLDGLEEDGEEDDYQDG